MTVKEYARRFGLSVSAVYYRIRKGIIQAFKRNRRWYIPPPMEEKPMDWHPQVAKRMAQQDGLGPEDFQWSEWPVFKVRLENSDSRHYPFYYRCDMPEDTPVSNQYVETKDRKPGVVYEPTEWPGWLKAPDPVGICLQSVEFRLYDAETNEELSEADTLLSDGVATSKPADRERLWQVLTPDTSLKVKLVAYPEFYYLNAEGSMVGYAIGNQGYFKGEEVESPVYTLSMDHDGNVEVK